jgi:polysaccharide pyruvyl transferase WcaK-like protein
MDITISMMLHSTILAFASGVPSISLGYDKKNKSFMQLTGQSNRYLDINKLSSKSLIKLINNEQADHNNQLKKLASRKLTLQKKQLLFNEQVAQLLSAN